MPWPSPLCLPEPVTMIVRPELVAMASLYCGPGITVLPMPHDDSWVRDSGPTFLLARSSVIRHAYLGQGSGPTASQAVHKETHMSDLSMLINGLAVSAEKGATFERRNPLDGSVATRAPAASEADAVAAVEAAAEAFKTWSQTGPGARRALLVRPRLARAEPYPETTP